MEVRCKRDMCSIAGHVFLSLAKDKLYINSMFFVDGNFSPLSSLRQASARRCTTGRYESNIWAKGTIFSNAHIKGDTIPIPLPFSNP